MDLEQPSGHALKRKGYIMAVLQPNANEKIIDSWMVVYWEPWGLFDHITCSGYVYATNQRVFFNSLVSGFTLEIPLEEITGFWTSKYFFVPVVTICSKNSKTFRFSGFKTKKLVDWLQEINIPEVSSKKKKRAEHKQKEKINNGF